MPLLKKVYPSPTSVLGIWQQNEAIADLRKMIKLSERDEKMYASFSVEKRQREWLCSRILLQLLMGENCQIIYDENRNPFLENSETNISITHCKNYVAVYLDNTKLIGCDIEEYRDRIKGISKKFLSDEEREQIPKENSVPKLTAYWCAKEVMYKYYSRKQVDFKKCLLVKPFELSEQGSIESKIIMEDFETDLSINYLAEKAFFIAFASGDK